MTTPPFSADLQATRTLFASLQLQASARGLTLRAPPDEPDSCCGRGCNGCVWESYYAAAAWWQEEALQRLDA